MRYRIETVDHPDYLRFKITGIWDQQTVKQIFRDTSTVLFQSSHKKALFDCRELTPRTSLGANYYDASYTADLYAEGGYQLAVLVNEQTHTMQDFFELVATNRGLNFRTFFDEAAAIAWLTKQNRNA